ncbi:tetratricopeptide repeat protein [Candidatus Sumerlaeota bacterium]|nr:tetratricopeptide repeat protein [Candidatus Sumerlaeota bacterium]
MESENERQDVSQTYQQGLGLLRAGKVAEGVETLRRVVPDMPKALGDIAWAYRARGDNDAAFAALKEYLEHFPRDANAWSLMACIERDRGEVAAAIRSARRATEVGPDNAESWFVLAELLFYSADWKGAVRAYSRGLKINPQKLHADTRCQHALRVQGLGRIRRLIYWRPVRSLIRRLLSSTLMAELIEADTGIARTGWQWRAPLDWGDAAPFVEPIPAGQEADRFATHFEGCRCSFWQWFRSLQDSGVTAAPPKKRVHRTLEIGGAPGHVAHHFALAGFDVLSLAANESARRDREKRGITAIDADFHFVGLRGGSFDLIVVNHALQLSRSPLLAAWEWKRLLRPDGYLLAMARLAVDRPASGGPTDSDVSPADLAHLTYGVTGHILTLSYWQLRWLFRRAGFLLIAEAIEDPMRGCLESVEHVDGRKSADPGKPRNAFFLLRKPGVLPFDPALEKPRPIAIPAVPA